jgi:hypothetical protein
VQDWRRNQLIFTLGWLGIGLLIDLFTLTSQVRKANGEQ